MTRKIFDFQELCTNDDLNAIVDDCVLNQSVAVWPFSKIATPLTSKVIGAPPIVASDGSDSMILALPFVPLRGDQVWFRYEYKNATTQNASITIDYQIYDLSSGQLLTTISKTKSLQSSKTLAVDVLNLKSVGGVDLSGTSLLIKMFAYWPGSANWFNAVQKTNFDNVSSWNSCILRPNDNAVYVIGMNSQYTFWDQAHAADTWSADRNTGSATPKARGAYHPGYGLFLVGYTIGSIKSAKIRNDIDHYTDAANSAETDVNTITGFSYPASALNNYEIDVCRDGDRFVSIIASDHVSAPYATGGAIKQNEFGTIGASPAWGGSAHHILNGPGSDEWIPETDSSHPAGAGVDPRILDVNVISDNPVNGGTLNYFVRYKYDAAGTVSTGYLFQRGTSQFEIVTLLNSWYRHGNTTYPEYGYVIPSVNPVIPSSVGLAVWEHKKIAANNHELRLRVLRKNFFFLPGWNFSTVYTVTGLTDADLGTWGYESAMDNGKGASNSPNMHIDYGFDRNGVEHIVYTRYDSVSGLTQVYYRKFLLSTLVWDTEILISRGSAWDGFDNGGNSHIWALALSKDNGIVPQPGPELRVCWSVRDFTTAANAEFIAGIRSSSGEDQIEVYAPEVFMGYRDDAAGPKDMLWP